MVNIDFYILSDEQNIARLLFCCRLTEKALSLGNKVHIHTNSAEETEQLDQLLWSFKPDSFIPHCHSQSELASSCPVHFGYDELQIPVFTDVLINMNHSIPSFHKDFKRITEIVVNEPSVKQSTRQHFTMYRDMGYSITSHDLRKQV